MRRACTSWAAAWCTLTTGDSQLGRAEPIEDSAKVISRMTDLVMIRTFEQTRSSALPPIRACRHQRADQRIPPPPDLADIFTYIEHRGSIAGKTVAWVGDGNNMANTWLQAAALLGFQGEREHAAWLQEIDEKLASGAQGKRQQLSVYSNPLRSLQGADLVTTDVWTSSMGYEAENEARKRPLPTGAWTPK